MPSNLVYQAKKKKKSDYFTLIDPKRIYVNNKKKPAELISMENRGDERLQEMRIEGDAQNTQADRIVQNSLQYFLTNKIILIPEKARACHRRQ